MCVLVMCSGAALCCGEPALMEPVSGTSSGAHSEKASSLCSICTSLASELHGQVLVPNKDETPLVTSYLEGHTEMH